MPRPHEAGRRRRLPGPLLAAAALALFAAATPAAWTPAAMAQETAPRPRPTVEQLERRLEQRDALIADLMRRVEALERERRTAAAPVAEREVPPAPRRRPDPAPGAAAPASPPVAPPPRQVAAAPAPAPGQLEVDEEAAARALERSLVQGGAILLRPGQAEVTPDLTYARSGAGATAVLGGDAGVPVLEQKVRRDRFEAGLGLRAGLPYDSQLELSVPYAAVDQSSVVQSGFALAGEEDRHGSGFGDLRIGLAKALLRERGWVPDLVGRLAWDTSTGEREDDGIPLGSGFDEAQVRLTASKRLDPLVFVGDLSYLRAFEEGDRRPGDQVGLTLATLLAVSPEATLSFLLGQTFIDETETAGREIRGSDTVVGNLGLGVSILLSSRALLDVSGTVGLTEDAPDYTVRVALPLRFDLPIY